MDSNQKDGVLSALTSLFETQRGSFMREGRTSRGRLPPISWLHCMFYVVVVIDSATLAEDSAQGVGPDRHKTPTRALR